MLEPSQGGFVRIKNRWRNTYIHNQKGPLELGAIQPGWWSALWMLKDAGGKIASTPAKPKTTTAAQPSKPAQSTALERRCEDLLGQVPYNRAGYKNWIPANKKAYCAGTTDPEAAVDCFKRGMKKRDDWEWALNACFEDINSFVSVPIPPRNANGSDILACSCQAATCGGDGVAVKGREGDLFTNISNQSALDAFKPREGTGWNCDQPPKQTGSPEKGPLGCYCNSLCGNGGIGATGYVVRLGVSQSSLDKFYGGGKPGNRTGWVCGQYRGRY